MLFRSCWFNAVAAVIRVRKQTSECVSARDLSLWGIIPTHTHTHAHTHARMHARTHKRTHKRTPSDHKPPIGSDCSSVSGREEWFWSRKWYFNGSWEVLSAANVLTAENNKLPYGCRETALMSDAEGDKLLARITVAAKSPFTASN